jgi:cobyrinic acid a,c-diamide synthase
VVDIEGITTTVAAQIAGIASFQGNWGQAPRDIFAP